MACYNLALASLHLDDMLGMIRELYELELFITPNMNVYKNLVQTGLDQLLFKKGFLEQLLILEEMLYIVMHGTEPFKLSEVQTKGNYRLITAILKTKLVKIDKLYSTDVVAHSEMREELPHKTRILMKKVQVDRINDYENFFESPISMHSSSQRLFVNSCLSPMNESGKSFSGIQMKGNRNMNKSSAKSVIYNNTSVGLNIDLMNYLALFVDYCLS